jgi:hypothetical protein
MPQDSPTKYDLVVLSKIDKEGNITLVHNKPLHLDLLNQVPDSIISFSEGFNSFFLSNLLTSDVKMCLFFFTI